MSKIHIMLDASALVHSSCLLRLKRIVIDGLTMKQMPNDIVYGSAFHKFVATMYESNGDFNKAIHAALDIWNKPKFIRNKWLTDHHLQNTCIDYWQHFQTKDTFQVLSSNGKPLVEFDFCNRYYEDDEFEIDLVGTIDKLGKIPNGINAFGDYKTHSIHSISKNGKPSEYSIDDFFQKFRMSLQLNFYAFNLMWKCKTQPEHPISKLILDQPLGYFIDGIFTSEKSKSIFRRSEIQQFSEKNYIDFGAILNQKVNEFIEYIKSGVDDNIMPGLINGSCNEHKYPCQFYNLCASGSDEARTYMTAKDFNTTKYNPLMFSK